MSLCTMQPYMSIGFQVETSFNAANNSISEKVPMRLQTIFTRTKSIDH